MIVAESLILAMLLTIASMVIALGLIYGTIRVRTGGYSECVCEVFRFYLQGLRSYQGTATYQATYW